MRSCVEDYCNCNHINDITLVCSQIVRITITIIKQPPIGDGLIFFTVVFRYYFLLNLPSARLQNMSELGS